MIAKLLPLQPSEDYPWSLFTDYPPPTCYHGNTSWETAINKGQPCHTCGAAARQLLMCEWPILSVLRLGPVQVAIQRPHPLARPGGGVAL